MLFGEGAVARPVIADDVADAPPFARRQTLRANRHANLNRTAAHCSIEEPHTFCSRAILAIFPKRDLTALRISDPADGEEDGTIRFREDSAQRGSRRRPGKAFATLWLADRRLGDGRYGPQRRWND